MVRRPVWFAFAALAFVLGCGGSKNVYSPGAQDFEVVRDAASFRSRDAVAVDFEGLPSNANSCGPDSTPSDSGGTTLDNPLVLEGVVFTDPFCLQTGFCSAPTCPEANIVLFLNQDGTIEFPENVKGVLLRIEGMEDTPFALEVTDGKGRTEIVEGAGIGFGTAELGFRSGHGIARIRVARVGPVPPGCTEAPCGPLALASLVYE